MNEQSQSGDGDDSQECSRTLADVTFKDEASETSTNEAQTSRRVITEMGSIVEAATTGDTAGLYHIWNGDDPKHADKKVMSVFKKQTILSEWPFLFSKMI